MSVGVYDLTPKEAKIYAVRLNELLRQLSPSVRLNSVKEWQQGLRSRNATLLVAKDSDKPAPENLVGMAYIFFQWRGEGWYAGVHTVVRDEAYRGQHVGAQLTSMIISKARIKSHQLRRPISMELTCRPGRETANRMYQRYGFKLVAQAVGPDGTNLYRMKF